jgi:hypothetical protein
MDPDTFTRAVRSMDGYDGMLGIMGGEPTLHPNFAELVETYDRLWPHDREATTGRYLPIRDFGEHTAKNLSNVDCRRGLWSSLGDGYREHYELIQRVFPYQCLNDHRNGSTHAPVLVSRKDLGIPNREWLHYRNSCWVQRLWSSSITPKGCFPCEIMASLDALYDGPGGWPITPGWWKKEPKNFGAMLDWCEMCGACLPLQPRIAVEGLHDVSPSHVARLADSPAMKDGKVVVHSAMPLVADPKMDPDWYMPRDDKRRRVHQDNKSTKVRLVEAVVVCVDRAAALAKVLPRNAAELDRVVVVTAAHDEETFAECLKYFNVFCVVTDACYEGGDAFNKGRMLNAGLAELRMDDWCLNLDADILLPENFREKVTSLTLNPGCLYYARRRDLTDDGDLGEVKDLPTNFRPWGYFQLWNRRASCLKNVVPLRNPDCFVSAGNVDTWWQHRWPADRRVPISQTDEFDVGHVAHGDLAARWNGEQKSRGWTYAGQSNFQPPLKFLPEGLTGDTWMRVVDVTTARVQETMLDNLKPGTGRLEEYQYWSGE